ncbi:MAG: hypothetical protein ACKOB1_09430 [Planctomycetia bacterium]
MNSLWKWMGLAACGVGLVCVADRMHAVTAAEDAPAYERPGESPDRLDRIAEKLDRLLERMEGRMGPGGPPWGDRRGPPHDGPHPEGPPHDHREHGGPPPHMRRDIPPETREMLERRMREGRERMEKTREEIKERMEKARARFEQLEERVKALEAEVERLKATK